MFKPVFALLLLGLYSTGFPSFLAVSDALILGSAVVSVWALGFGFKIVRKFLKG